LFTFSVGTGLLDVGLQLTDLVFKTFLGFRFELTNVTLEVSLLPVLVRFIIQGSLGDECSVVNIQI
jgi:hypothetical protein